MAVTVLAEENPLIPHWDELILGIICFFLVFGFLGKFVLPRVREVLRQRTETIEGGIENARRLQEEAEQTRAAYRAQLDGAHQEAAQLRQDAQQQSVALLKEARATAEERGEAIVQAARAQSEAEGRQVRSALTRDTGLIALDLAERIIGRELHDPKVHQAVIDDFLSHLEAEAATAESGAVR